LADASRHLEVLAEVGAEAPLHVECGYDCMAAEGGHLEVLK
jgi:hypothetical protein